MYLAGCVFGREIIRDSLKRGQAPAYIPRVRGKLVRGLLLAGLDQYLLGA